MKYKTEREMLKNTLLKDGDYKSTKEVFERIAKMYPKKPILAELDQSKNIIYHTCEEVLKDVENLGDGMLSLGLENKHIALIAENSYRYLITDLTIAGGVGVITPIDKDANDDLLIYLLNTCDADAIVCSAYLTHKIERILPSCQRVKTIITIDKKVDNYLFLTDIMELGAKDENCGKYRSKELNLDQTVEILFTSGTTGVNKPVELTQRNMSANMINCLDSIKAEEKNNTSMSILPMHHATEINTHILPRISACRLTYINGSMKDMMTNIKIFKPYVITVVPMIANIFYKTIWQQATKQGMDKKLKKGIKLCKLLSKFNIDITHKLFKQVYEPFGGNLKQIVCGGAPLNPEVVKGMKDLGIYIINGFGITECGPLVSMNADTFNEVYSIGKACPKLEVKIDNIDENGVGELCVRGDSVSKRYYKDPESTAKVHDKDGFFHTGDLVYMDKKKRLYIAGRKKNLIVLENGKNVYPEELEEKIHNSIKEVREVMVYEGDCYIKNELKHIICAQIYLDAEANIDNQTLISQFRKLNQEISSYKRIGYVIINKTEFEKSGSKKIIRTKALQRHSTTNGLII